MQFPMLCNNGQGSLGGLRQVGSAAIRVGLWSSEERHALVAERCTAAGSVTLPESLQGLRHVDTPDITVLSTRKPFLSDC